MPLNQKGSRVFGVPGSGYTELEAQKLRENRKPKSAKEAAAVKKAMKKKDEHKTTSRSSFKLRNPRI